MSGNVLLIMQSPRKKSFYINNLPPIGLLSIASFLKSQNIPVRVRDCYIAMVSEDDLHRADIVGLSINIANVENSLKMAAHIKEAWPKKKVILGGPFCMSLPDELIRQPGVDAVAVCEGEELMCELVSGKPWDEVKGLYLKDMEGKPFFTGQREWIKDLDRLPFPSLDMLDIRRYYSPVKKALPISSIITSRGCPYNCIFCMKSTGPTWRARSAKNTVDEIEWQVKKLGVREICIYDENFTMDIRRAEEICNLIISRKIHVHLQLTNGIRVDKLTRSLIPVLKLAGVWIIGVAPETGNSETLRRIGKGFGLDKVTDAVRWCRKEGLAVWAFFMIGFPWESISQIENTIRYAVALDAELTHFARVIAFPGTQLYKVSRPNRIADWDVLHDRGLFHGAIIHQATDLTEMSLNRLITKAYRTVYFQPVKWFRLLHMLSWRDLWRLFLYSLMTRNV